MMTHKNQIFYLLTLYILLIIARANLVKITTLIDLPHRQINPVLSNQKLSHFAFHSNPAKKYLTDIARLQSNSTNSIAVVGVEWGVEVVYLASIGYHVYAFEPLSVYVEELKKRVRDEDLNVTIVEKAAGSTNGRLNLTYENGGITEEVDVVMIDEVVGPLLVLSVDTQGSEFDILKGGKRILENGVGMLWIEVIACNKDILEMLEMLDERFVVFDFVKWGLRKGADGEGVPRSRESFAVDVKGGRGFEEFWKEMCEMQKEQYEWLQTDIVAIRRDAMTSNVLQILTSMAKKVCEEGGCVLRDLIDSENHDEL